MNIKIKTRTREATFIMWAPLACLTLVGPALAQDAAQEAGVTPPADTVTDEAGAGDAVTDEAGAGDAATEEVGGGNDATDDVGTGDAAIDDVGAGDAEKSEEIEEIVVTATRRKTKLLETPVAVTVIDPNLMFERSINNLLNIEALVPSLKVQDQRTLGMGAVQLSMRGIGNTNFTEQGDPNVGFHVDSIYLPRPQAAISFLYDVERVEVLRGPQGTLFGRNSTAGTINVVTVKPQFNKDGGSVEGQLGRFNERLVRGVVNVPLIDDVLAMRVTAFAHGRDSYFDLRYDDVLCDGEGYDFCTQDDAVFDNSDPPQLITPGNNDALGGNPYLALGDPTDTKNGAGSIHERGFRVAARLAPLGWLESMKSHGTFELNGSYEKYFNQSPAAPLTTRANPYLAYLDMPHTTDQQIDGYRASAKYDIFDLGSFNYAFGYTRYEHEMTIDLDAGVHRYRPAVITAAPDSQFFWDQPYINDSRSHEVQFQSNWALPVQALVGYFDFREETERNLWIDIPQPAGGLILFNQPERIAESRAVFGEVFWDFLDNFQLRGGVRYSMDRKIDVDGSRSDAFPGSVGTVPFGCPVAAQIYGITPEEARANNLCGISTGQQQFAPPYTFYDRVFNNDESFTNLDWQVTASYQLNDTLIHAKVATGHKSGGFQDTFFLPRTGQVIFPVLKPEELISYEVGVKTALLNGRLRISADAYFMDYNHKQESVLVNFGDLFCPYTFGDFNQDGQLDINPDDVGNPDNPVFLYTQVDSEGRINATPEQMKECNSANFNLTDFPIDMVELLPLNVTDAMVGGLELEWFIQISPADRVTGYATFIPFNKIGNVDTSQLPLKVTDSMVCQDREGGCPDIKSVDGNKLPFAPVVSMALNYAHDFNLGDFGQLTPSGFFNFSSGYYLSIWNVDCYTSVSTGEEVCDNGDKQEPYVTLDLNLRYLSPMQDWFIEGFATNVTGTQYATFNRRKADDDVTGYAFNPRRSWGVRAGYNW